MKEEKLIGKYVVITDKESIYYNQWGKIVYYDGMYHVEDCDDKNNIPVFDRDQFIVKRKFKGYE